MRQTCCRRRCSLQSAVWRAFVATRRFPARLYKIAQSSCLKKRRRSRFAARDPEPLDGLSPGELVRLSVADRDPEEQVSDREQATIVESAIGTLNPALRAVLLLRDVEGLPARDVARALGVSVVAVKSRLHRARVALRAAIAPVLGLPVRPPVLPRHACRDLAPALSAYVDKELDAQACADMKRHLGQCEPCQADCDSLLRTLDLCRRIAAPPVPDPIVRQVQAAIRAFLSSRTAGT